MIFRGHFVIRAQRFCSNHVLKEKERTTKIFLKTSMLKNERGWERPKSNCSSCLKTTWTCTSCRLLKFISTNSVLDVLEVNERGRASSVKHLCRNKRPQEGHCMDLLLLPNSVLLQQKYNRICFFNDSLMIARNKLI